ncbi:hypothetical protein THRCLA_08188 [Thraustotheca clavata]|uniref:Ankyrin repeat protein n=1 Tax=Thraustotheca clavata TaxID=74557 RepID=A0A1V9Z8Q1_9STRA|nr:hypothetical protein THRCLA_08188 [Thraustotheca clavata]
MDAAVKVLKNLNLVKLTSQYQDGLPPDLVEITQLAKSIVIWPNLSLPTLLSNIPSRFYDTSYLQLFKHCNLFVHRDCLPDYALFLRGYDDEQCIPFHLSIVENNINHVKMWLRCKPKWVSPAPLKLAGICGHLEIIKILINASRKVLTKEAMDLAAMNGYLDVIKIFHCIENGPRCTTKAMDGAAAFDHLEVVQFLNENRSEGCTSKALNDAANNGYAKVVQICPKYYGINCHRAKGEKDYIGVIRCLSNHNFTEIDEVLVKTAIKSKPLPTIKFLYNENIHGITTKILDTVIRTGDKAAIRHALEAILIEDNKSISLLDHDEEEINPWAPLDNQDLLRHLNWSDNHWNNCNAMDIAAAFGDFDTVKLLHRTGIKCCTVESMNNAAAIGRLDIVEWLHTHRTEGCNINAMTYAVAGRHFKIVKWLHDVRGLLCTNYGLATAAHNGDIDILKYLISIPMAPDDIDDGRGTEWIYLSSNTPCIKVSCGFAVDQAASNGHIGIVNLNRLSCKHRSYEYGSL